ncbi:MAG: ABC transporter ATP-binding protein [Oscillospiraceae bacterium]|nr:ABC transporter ATP-binding protein [Oscillospiraceae bacterium]
MNELVEKDVILEVNNLRTSFYTDEGEVKAVNGISFSIKEGSTLGIVGESGSGKSITSLSILQLFAGTTGKIIDGEILFKGENLLEKTHKEMMKLRGNSISMIFQEPMTSLNPTMTCGEQIAETIRTHQKLSKTETKLKAIEMLRLVGIPEPEKRIKLFPYQLSGGMRQRVMIAIALSCNPDLLIADEPTTALDVTIQAQILELIKNLQKELGTSLIMITHDLGVIAEMCDFVAVMYCGKIIEYTDIRTLFNSPKHPYTVGLLNSVPSHEMDSDEDLKIISGTVPSPYDLPTGCLFSPRCPHAKAVCHESMPELRVHEDGGLVSCFIYEHDKWQEER